TCAAGRGRRRSAAPTPQRPRRPAGPAACTRGRTARAPWLAQALEPERQVVGVDAEAHAGADEVRGWPVEEHLALEDDDAVEVVGHRAELVGDEQHGGAVLVDEVGERLAEAAL